MQAVLLPPTNLSFERGGKVRKLIFWMLDSYSARLIELEGEGIQDSNALRKEWLKLRMKSDEEEREFSKTLCLFQTTHQFKLTQMCFVDA